MRPRREHLALIPAVEFRQTRRGLLWLGSGTGHWAWLAVVEVRQGTLRLDGRGWVRAETTVDRVLAVGRGQQGRRGQEGGPGGRGGEGAEEEDEAGGGNRH